jgi:hypothetical protein
MSLNKFDNSVLKINCIGMSLCGPFNIYISTNHGKELKSGYL